MTAAPTASTGAPHGSGYGGAEAAVAGGALIWAIAALYWFLRPGLWILDLLLVPAAWLLGIGGLIMMAAGAGALVRRSPRRAGALSAAALLALAATVLLAPWWQFWPRGWFAVHRPLFAQALRTDPGRDYDGARLPFAVSFLTADGRVSQPRDGIRFFPQWIGTPDDAGGYLYSPGRPPVDVDLRGAPCTSPADLGGGWWMCGLRS